MTRDIHRRALLTAAGALYALTLTSCGPASVSRRNLRIGYQKSGVLVTAKRRGTLLPSVRATGIENIDWIEFQYGPPLVEALGAGSLDIGAVGDAPLIFGQAAGQDFLYAAAIRTSGAAAGVLVPSSSKLTQMAELKGKRLCFTRATSANVTAMRALKAAGLSLSDVEYINLNPADAAAAFAQGGIDAWVIWDPYFTIAIRQQSARVLVPGETLGGRPSFVIASKAYAERQSEQLRAVLDALADEAKWASAHRDDAARLISEETGIPPELMRDIIRRTDFDLSPVSSDIVADQQATADQFLELGQIPKPIAVKDIVWSGWQGPS